MDKMELLSPFYHPHSIPNLLDFLSSAEQIKRYFEECFNFLLALVFVSYSKRQCVVQSQTICNRPLQHIMVLKENIITE